MIKLIVLVLHVWLNFKKIICHIWFWWPKAKIIFYERRLIFYNSDLDVWKTSLKSNNYRFWKDSNLHSLENNIASWQFSIVWHDVNSWHNTFSFIYSVSVFAPCHSSSTWSMIWWLIISEFQKVSACKTIQNLILNQS